MKNQISTPNQTKKVKRLYAILAVAIFAVLVIAVFKVASPHNKTSQGIAPGTKVSPVATVNITKSGFEPATLTVKQGEKIIWTNTDNSMHQVAANPYPTDTGLTGLKSEILNNAQTYTYVAGKVGTFGYHDQMQPTINGTLVVEKK